MTGASGRPVVLVLRALGIGDFATGVPALRAIRRAYPDARVALAAPAALTPLAASSGAVDDVVPIDGVASLPPVWDLPHPAGAVDVAVNLHGAGPQSHQLLRNVAPRRLMAFACEAAGFRDGPLWRDEEHEVTRWCRMVAWYGIDVDPRDLALSPPPPPPEVGAVVVHPGAKSPRRRWPPRRYAAVAGALARAGHRVVVTGTPAEASIAHEIAATAALPPQAVRAGRTSVADLAATVAHARLVICGDTGVGHLATAYGTPSVLLFGPMPPHLWGPPPEDDRHRVLWHGAAAPRQYQGHGPDPALLRITVSEVLAAAFPLLSAA